MKTSNYRARPVKLEVVRYTNDSDQYEIARWCGGYVTETDAVVVPVVRTYDGDRTAIEGEPLYLSNYLLRDGDTCQFSIVSDEEFDFQYEPWPEEGQGLAPQHYNPDTGEYNPNEA